MNDEFSLSSRAISSFVAVSDCGSARAMFAESVSPAKLVKDTPYEPTLAMSLRAITRGISFENMLRKDDYANLRKEIAAHLGVAVPDSATERQGSSDPARKVTLEQRRARWEETKRAVKTATRWPGTPVLIDGAQVETGLRNGRGDEVYYEADYLLAVHGGVWVMECKSWPVIGGMSESPSGDGKALDQAALYVATLQDLFESEGMERVEVLGIALVNPSGPTAYPVLRSFPLSEVRRRVDKARETVAAVILESADPVDLEGVEDLPPADRVAAVESLIRETGHYFDPEVCANNCALALYCHDRSYQRGDVSIIGAAKVLDAAGVETFAELRALADGGEPEPAAAELAADLVYARSLVGDL